MPKFKPNAYGEFVSEFRKQKAENNINYPSFEAAAKDAGPIWQSMSQSEKNEYKLKALKHREQLESGNMLSSNSDFPRSNGYSFTKKTCQGKLLSEVDYQQQRNQEFIKRKKLYTQHVVKNSPELLKHNFFFMHSIPYITDEIQHYHAEVALAKFSLNSGIIATQHMFIHHSRLPTGYIHEAQTRHDREHHIALPPKAEKVLNPKSYTTAFDEITKFLQPDPDGYYHIYTKEDDIRVVENFFECASRELGNSKLAARYLVHDYLDLYFYLMKTYCKENQTDSVYKSMIKETITTDRHDMKKILSCEYHNEVDCLPCCSLSKVQRWICYICEDICNDLNIYMIEGFHYPVGLSKAQVFRKQSNNENHPEKNLCFNSSLSSANNTGHFEWKVREIRDFKAKGRPERNNLHSSGASTSYAPRQGSTAALTRISRGGRSQKTLVKDKEESSSSDECEYPHNDVDYAKIVKPWDVALSAADKLRNENSMKW